MNLILSLFPGIDVLGRGFELEGCCVVRGPDLLWGQSIEAFHAPPGIFDGVIAGSPCQSFSGVNRTPQRAEGERLLKEFTRVVTEARPDWWLIENVPSVPDVEIEGYRVQRFFLSAKDCGLRQIRNRRFQFGSLDSRLLIIERDSSNASKRQGDHTSGRDRAQPSESPDTHTTRDGHAKACLATEGRRKHRRSFADFCELQGLGRDFDLPGWPVKFKYAAVGNAVALLVARCVARAIVNARCSTGEAPSQRVCACECGRIVSGGQITATPACRKRRQKERERREALSLKVNKP